MKGKSKMEENLTVNEKNLLEILEFEELKNVSAYLQKFYSIWVDFGISDEQKLQRAKVVWKHVQNLLQDILEEEVSFYKDIKERIESYTRKIEILSNELSITPKEDCDKSIIKKEESLRQELDSLTKLKHKRLKAYHELRSVESVYCTVLGVQECQLPTFNGVPSENDLIDIDNHIHELTKERDRRHKKFCLVKKELTTILETTELSPETSFEKEILSSESDTVSLSDKTFETLERVVHKAQSRKTELMSQRKVLLDKLSTIWDQLKVPEARRIEFLTEYMDCKVSTLNAIQNELELCEKMATEKMKRNIEAMKKELKQLWDQCFVSDVERKSVDAYYCDEMSAEVIEALGYEIDKWKNYYEEAKAIMVKIEKRKELWDMLLMFENKATDPNRFKNRGCNLLQEEKDRKNLQRDLPALENDIFYEIDLYEASREKPFLYYGEDYRSFVANQWQERIELKENQKKRRYKQRFMDIENKTPLRKPLLKTPKSAPCKLMKGNFEAVNEPSVYYTPLEKTRLDTQNNVKKYICTPGKDDIKCKLFSSEVPIKNKNLRNVQLIDYKDSSNASNCTTYSEFASELTLNKNDDFQSSILTKKTPQQTKSAKDVRNKNINVVKQFKKSVCNVLMKSPSATPTRAKLGLPFLI